MADLGKYAAEVVSAYAVSLALLAAIIGLSWWQAVRMARALRRAEECDDA